MKTLLILSLFVFSPMSLADDTAIPAYADPSQAKKVVKPVQEKHRVCYRDADCGIARNSCCGGVAVNRAFVKNYEVSYDSLNCQMVKCLHMESVCVEQKCELSRPKRGR